MGTVVFDTLKFANRLKEAGFTEQQATVITELQCETAAVTLEQAHEEYHLDELSSKRDMKELEVALRRDMKELEVSLKRDVKELEASLRSDIALLRAETKKDIAESKAELVRWVVGVGLLQTTLIIGVLLKVAHLI